MVIPDPQQRWWPAANLAVEMRSGLRRSAELRHKQAASFKRKARWSQCVTPGGFNPGRRRRPGRRDRPSEPMPGAETPERPRPKRGARSGVLIGYE
jgi:hypothetical protein